jgi:hypothetical protein
MTSVHEMCLAQAKKATANLVGFGGPGLCCFVAEHAKDSAGAEEKGKAITIVRVK